MSLTPYAPLINSDDINITMGAFVMRVHDTLEPVREFPELVSVEPELFIPIVSHTPKPERWWKVVWRILNMDVRDVWREVKRYWRQ